MAAIEIKVFTLLGGSATVTNTVTSSIYAGTIPDTATFPAIMYTRDNAEPINYLSGESSGERIDLEINCYATAYKASHQLSTIVEKVMFGSDTFKAQLITNRMEVIDYPDRKKLFNTVCDFGVWNQRGV